MIQKIDFKLQGKELTHSYIDGLIKIFVRNGAKKDRGSPLNKLAKVRSGLKSGSVAWNVETRKRIRSLVCELDRKLPSEGGIRVSVETETKKLCGRLRVKKHYNSKKSKKVKIEIYASTKEVLDELRYEFTSGGEVLSWPKLMEEIVSIVRKNLPDDF